MKHREWISPDRGMLYRLILILFFFCSSFYSFCQHYNFRHITKEDGLPSSYIYDMNEDEKGYLWFATDKGISRYDGKEFKAYGSTHGFNDIGAYRIFKDKRKKLWFISFNWHLYLLQSDQLQRRFNGRLIQWIDADKCGNKYAAERNGNLMLFTDEAVIKEMPLGEGTLFFLKILKNRNEALLAGIKRILYLKDRRSNRVSIYKNPSVTSRFFELSDGRLLICDNAGIHLFDKTGLSATNILPFRNNEVLCCYEDSVSKDVWMGTRLGIYLFKKGNIGPGLFAKYLDAAVTSIFKSKDGTMWFTTTGDGVYYCNFASVHFTTEDGLSDNAIESIRKQGDYIYALPRKCQISFISNKKTSKITFNDSLALNIENFQSAEGPVYIKTADNYLVLKNRNIKKFPIPTIRKIEDSFYNIAYTDSIQNIYYVTINNGKIFLYDNKKGFYDYPDKEMQNYIQDLRHKPGFQQCRLIFISAGGTLFFITEKGLLEAGRRNGSYYYRYDSSYYSGINDVVFMPGGNIAVATKGQGLALVVKGKRYFYNTANGLAADYVSHVYAGKGSIWACTSGGLVQLNADENGKVTYLLTLNASNLLISDEVNDLAIAGHDFYVATNKGISLFNETEVSVVKYNPSVYIQHLEINDRDTVPEGAMRLPYNQNDISVGFRALSYTKEEVQYRYKLEGADNFYHLSKQDNIKYAGLNPGTYVFRVYAKAGNGTWNLHPASLQFTIVPPFWRTLWFLLLSSACLTLLIFLIAYRIIRSNHKKEETKRKMIESELKAIRLHMNPHFIFNTLNSLQSYILSNKAIEANNYLSIFSRLIRLIMQYAQLKEISLAEEVEFLNMYVELEQMRFEEKFEFAIEIRPGISPTSTFIPPLTLQPFIENAIKHGIGNKKTNSHIGVTIEREDHYLKCIIEDDGIGRAKAAAIKKQSIHQYISTGIAFTAERLSLLDVHGNNKNPVEIHDIYNGQNEPCGTKVELYIPLS